MSSIKVNQYKTDLIPKEIEAELSLLSPTPLNELTAKLRGKQDIDSHYFTLSNNGTLLGFAVFSTDQDTACIHTIFISEPYRDKTLGQKLALRLITKAVQKRCKKVNVECEQSALSFFTKLGFVITRHPSKQHNRPLFSLENPCPEYYLSVYKESLVADHKRKTQARYPLVLSKDQTLYNYHDEKEFLALHRNMLSQAQRRIWLICDNINSPILTDEFFNQSILKLVKYNSHAEIRILLKDDKTGVGYFNPVVNLAQRLSSFVEIRSLRGNKKVSEMITTVDFTAGIYRKNLDSFTGFATYNNHLIAQRLQDNYEKHWQFAKPSMETRRLSI